LIGGDGIAGGGIAGGGIAGEITDGIDLGAEFVDAGEIVCIGVFCASFFVKAVATEK
jgi:hypothetical protein